MSDVHKEWFNIPEDQRPPTYYQLLGVRDFESDTDAIDRASRERIRFLRARQLDQRYEDEVQQLLNEVARARVTLRNPKSKDAYDRKLRGEDVVEGPCDIDSLAERTYHCLDVRDFETMRDLLEELRGIEGSEAEGRRRQERLHDIFDTCMLRAQRALHEQEYDEVMIYTEEALGIFPGDSAVQRLRRRAQGAMLEEERSEKIVMPNQRAPSLEQPPASDESKVSKSASVPILPPTDHRAKTFIGVGIPAVPPIPDPTIKNYPPQSPVKPSWATQLFVGGCLAASVAALAGAIYLWVRSSEPNNIINTAPKKPPLEYGGQRRELLVQPQTHGEKSKEHDPARREKEAKEKYDSAEKSLKAGEEDKAKKTLESLIKEYHETASAARAGELLAKIQTGQEAEKTEQTARKLYELGRRAFFLRDYDRAIRAWTRLIQKYPNSSFTEQAGEKLPKAKEAEYNQQAKQLYDEAEKSRQEGNLDDARKKFERLRDNFPDWENMGEVDKALEEVVDIER